MPGRLFPKPFEGQAPQEFGRGTNILKTRTFDLTVARDLEEIEIGGSCLWALTATSLSASIDVRINDQLRDPLTFQQGMFIRGVPFSRIYVSHAAQVGAAITLFFAVEEDVRNIEIINPSTQFNNVNIGNISQDDSWAYESMQKRAFIGGRCGKSSIGNWYSNELWNPADSGKLLLCDEIAILSAAAMTIDMNLSHHNAALGSTAAVGNKWLTEAAGVGTVQYEDGAASVGTSIADFCNLPSVDRKIKMKDPFVIDPGTGLIVNLNSSTERMCTIFHWTERDE